MGKIRGITEVVRKGNIAILGTLDTKGREVAHMREFLEGLGYSTTIVDVGSLGPPGIQADISSGEIARRGGVNLSGLVQTAERDRIIEGMGRGATEILSRLYRKGRIDGVI